MMEFHNPIGDRHYLSIQHIERYKFAIDIIFNNFSVKDSIKILDIACGSGYGSAMLERTFIGSTIIAADYDFSALSTARKILKYSHLVRADALCLPFKEESFDVVISFETIEHVNDGDKFLYEMKRVLKKGGIFICSTPNIRYTNHPHFHLKEYDVKEFFDLLEKHFTYVDKYAQYFKLRDRYKDIFNWKLKNKIVKILDYMDIKEIIKEFLKKRRQNQGNKLEAISSFLTKEIISKPKDKYYQVIKYNGEDKLLRIMIGVCKK